MENIVYNELLVCGYNVDVGIVDVMAKNVDGSCAGGAIAPPFHFY